MTLILETGSGVRTANSYVTIAFVTSYLSNRSRVTENSWSTQAIVSQEGACIAATDYIDSRWDFKGIRIRSFTGTAAQAVASFTSNPSAADTLTVGDLTYAFVAALDALGSNEILIGVDTVTTIANLIASIGGTTEGRGTTYSQAQEANTSVFSAVREGTTTEVLFTSVQPGESGNDIPLAETSSAITLLTATFQNGTESGSQPLAFPRTGLSDDSGRAVVGVPVNLKQATAEYAVRSLSSALYRDPTIDDTGRAVIEKFVKVDVIEERTEYEEGSVLSALIKPYPAADKLLDQYIKAAGGVVR